MTNVDAWFRSPLRRQILEARRATRMSLRTAADRLGVHPGALSAYERGDRVPPTPVLERILAGYGFDLIAAPKGTPVALVDAAVEAAGQLRVLADRLDRPAPILQAVAA